MGGGRSAGAGGGVADAGWVGVAGVLGAVAPPTAAVVVAPPHPASAGRMHASRAAAGARLIERGFTRGDARGRPHDARGAPRHSAPRGSAGGFRAAVEVVEGKSFGDGDQDRDERMTVL